ncbi:MAG TPA: hypothetical protein PLG90_10165 [Ignavibacteria bacterium]|nr:hypothetical protein [Ignavibacteria bacterium]
MDLTKYYCKDLDRLDLILRNKGIKPSDIGQTKRFLLLKEGDIIALKSVGSPRGKMPRLEIVGYAVVVKREGIIYRHDPKEFPKGLGHMINVEFIDFDIKRTFELSYAQTIHKIENEEVIKKVFGEYTEKFNELDKLIKSDNNNGTNLKNIDKILVSVSGTYLKNAFHNIYQQQIYDYYYKLFNNNIGRNKIKMEVDYIDLIKIENNKIELIEVKPFDSVIDCIREGIGQLLYYYYKYLDKYDIETEKVSIKIIGKNKPNYLEENFIKYIKLNLKIKFDYDSWERLRSV